MTKVVTFTMFSFRMLYFVGNDPVDEDVDIGGNEPPVSSYPPVEIEKDAGRRSSKCNSSGTSSGNSGWSSYTSSIISVSLFCFPISFITSRG